MRKRHMRAHKYMGDVMTPNSIFVCTGKQSTDNYDTKQLTEYGNDEFLIERGKQQTGSECYCDVC